MTRIELLACALLLAMAAGCATTGPVTQAGPDAAIPVFAKDDPRVATAGFVAETLRLHQERDGTRHTLMAFAVGDTLTLGAMVRGPFAGQVRWQIGERVLCLPFDTEHLKTEVPVTIDTMPSPFRGQSASFRGTAWVNVDLPLVDWGGDGTALQLSFVPRTGASMSLPDDGYHYVMRPVSR